MKRTVSEGEREREKKEISDRKEEEIEEREKKNTYTPYTKRKRKLKLLFLPLSLFAFFWFLHAFARDECHDLHNCYKTRSCQHSFTVFFFNLATSSHISDELYYPNRQYLKQYISLATHESSRPTMTPPAGDHLHPYVDSPLTSFQQTNSHHIDEWLSLDSNNGFIRLYDPNDTTTTPPYSRSKLVPCSMRTTIEQICTRSNNELDSRTWYVQYHGDRLRHLRPDERPLFIQHDYLLSIGYSSVQRLQDEGDKHDLGYLIRFLSGRRKPFFDSIEKNPFFSGRSSDH